jgi:hypothetical protein
MSLKQVVTVDSFSMWSGVKGTLTITWDRPGAWYEDGKMMFGVVEEKDIQPQRWFSVIDAQNFADQIGAEFVNNLKATSLRTMERNK